MSKKSEITIEMVVILLLALAFALVVIYLIIKNDQKFRDLLTMFSGLL